MWHPRYWPMHVGFALLRLTVTILPFGALLAVGAWCGRIGYIVARRRRHIAEINIKLCFPDLPDSVRQERVRRHFEAVCYPALRDGFSPGGAGANASKRFSTSKVSNILSERVSKAVASCCSPAT